MEIVLGIDNIVFTAILVAKLPKSQQAKARQIGISLALIFRLALLNLFSIFDHGGGHISKGYIYFAMGFSLLVEFLNMRFRRKATPVSLRTPLPLGIN